MNEQNMEKIMCIYAKSAEGSKKHDLSKFMNTETAPHHSTAPMKRRIICISLCVLLIAAFCISGYLASQPYPPLWDLEITEFSSFHAGMWSVPADQIQTLSGCIAKDEPTALKMKNVILPKLPCRDITAYWLHQIHNKTYPVGIVAALEPASGPVSKLDVYYLWSSSEFNQEILQEYGFANLLNTTLWQGLDISYSKFQIQQDGILYKIYFESNGQLCAADIYTASDATLAELLNAIFA